MSARKEIIEELNFDYETDQEHLKQTNYIIEYIRRDKTADIQEHILQAANWRRFIG